MTLGNRISTLRTKNNYSQEYLAEQIGLSRQSISKWENNISRPDTKNLIRLAELFHVSVEYLTTGKDNEAVISTKESKTLSLSVLLKKTSLLFFLLALLVHCIGIFTGEFSRNLIPFFPYLWYGKSTWAIVLNVFTVLFSISWVVLLSFSIKLRDK